MPSHLSSMLLGLTAVIVPACVAPHAPVKQHDPIEAVVRGNYFEVGAGAADPRVKALHAQIQEWIAALPPASGVGPKPSSGPESTGDQRAVVVSTRTEDGEYQVEMWRTALGDHLSGKLEGLPNARRSSDRFLLYEAADSSMRVMIVDTWKPVDIPRSVEWIEFSSNGRWLGGSGTSIVGGRIEETGLTTELRLQLPGRKAFGRVPHDRVYWLPFEDSAVLSTGVLVQFKQNATTSLPIGAVVGVVEHQSAVLHVNESGRKLSATRITGGQIQTEQLNHERVARGERVRTVSPSGHLAVARSGMLAPRDRLVRVRTFESWGEPPPGSGLVRSFLVFGQVAAGDEGDSKADP